MQKNQGNKRIITLLDKDWKFINSEVKNGEGISLDDSNWDNVEVPHDWAISGEFDKDIDVHPLKNGINFVASTGALPHVGVGWYRKTIEIPEGWKGKKIFVEFDGAMSNSKVYFNGGYIGEWPYGYASFAFDLTDKTIFGKDNILAVRLENKPLSSRWYPGAGIYRNVRLVATNPVHIRQWGTYITTPDIADGKGTVKIETSLDGLESASDDVILVTEIYDADGQLLASDEKKVNGSKSTHQLLVEKPALWSIENPNLYKAVSIVEVGGKQTDRYETVFGFRHFEFTSDEGFFLNGEAMKLKGVCMHHDLGALGAAVNKSAIQRRLVILKEMGCNAIRTTHNPPAPELLHLADEMGFLVIDEAFDEWKYPKCKNGYNTLWDDWAEKDLVAMIQRDRNHPSIIMWSLGNEIAEQGMEDGALICKFLNDICKREDPSRPTTAGFNGWEDPIRNGLAEVVDVPGWNYKANRYRETKKRFPDWSIYGSETVSTVSSRGEYFLPAKPYHRHINDGRKPPYHCSSYELDFPGWGYPPDVEFAAQDSFNFVAGEFVWTGFDYLGEPTPYYEEWPSRSSYFGIVDLVGLPKNRYYLYQSKWSDKNVLHLLPHWNWEGKEEQIIPVHCFTNFKKAELFLNGKSMGVREKDPSDLYTTYRLIWDVPYKPGELKVVGLNSDNEALKEVTIRTARAPAKINLLTNKYCISHSEKELIFVTASVVDENGVLCPKANNKITFNVEGAGQFKAAGNGDPTCLERFVESERSAFNGKCIGIFKSISSNSEIIISAHSEGLENAEVKVIVID